MKFEMVQAFLGAGTLTTALLLFFLFGILKKETVTSSQDHEAQLQSCILVKAFDITEESEM